MRRARLLLAGAALSLVASGCSGGSEGKDPEPRIAPTAPSSAASAPTGPVEPTLPPEAEGEDAAAAEAFVRFYWEMVNYAQATGDVEGLRGLATESCAACRGGADGIWQIYQAGGSVDGGVVSVRSLSAEPFEAGSAHGFVVVARTYVSRQIVDVPGEEPERYAGGPNRVQLIVEATDNGWRIGRWDSQ